MSALLNALLAIDLDQAPAFAVLDGAQFDNLPAALSKGGFVWRSLYHRNDRSGSAPTISAPHLVWIDESSTTPFARSVSDTLHGLDELIDGKPAAVFWQCPNGGEALYKHLRTINKVVIPPDERSSNAHTGQDASAAGDMMVLFRHADANVLAQTVGAMTEAEAARFMGPATALYFAPDPDWAGGRRWLCVDKDADWPPARSGPLTLSRGTLDRMNGKRLRRCEERVMAYLREVAPGQTRHVSDAALGAATARYIKEATRYGVKSEVGLGRWCYLQVVTGGEMGKQKSVTDFLLKKNLGLDPNASADDRVATLMRMAAAQAEGMER